MALPFQDRENNHCYNRINDSFVWRLQYITPNNKVFNSVFSGEDTYTSKYQTTKLSLIQRASDQKHLYTYPYSYPETQNEKSLKCSPSHQWGKKVFCYILMKILYRLILIKKHIIRSVSEILIWSKHFSKHSALCLILSTSINTDSHTID